MCCLCYLVHDCIILSECPCFTYLHFVHLLLPLTRHLRPPPPPPTHTYYITCPMLFEVTFITNLHNVIVEQHNVCNKTVNGIVVKNHR